MKAVTGASAQAEITYTNGLAFDVRMPLFGPCWHVKSESATVDCSGDRPSVVIGPHQTVDLVGTVWARAGFEAGGAPLAPGRYNVDIGDHMGETLGYDANEAVYIDVTAS